MKRMKKFLAFVLAMIMCLGMAVTASAQNESAGGGPASIKINKASKGESYTVYKIFDAIETTSESESVISYKYTKNEGVLPATYEVTVSTADSDGQITETTETRNNTFFEIKDGMVFPLAAAYESGELPEPGAVAEMSEGAIDYLKYLASSTTYSDTIGTYVADSSPLTITGLGYGYYLVTSTLNGGSAVSVNGTNPQAVMNEKNSTEPTWTPDPEDPEKKGKMVKPENGNDTEYAETLNANIGDTVTFRLRITTQNYNEDGKLITGYEFKDDVLSKNFTNVNIVSVKVFEDGTEAATPTYRVDSTTTNFPINVSWVDANKASIYKANSILEIVYTAELATTAVIDHTGNENTASFSYTYVDPENPDGPDTKTEEITDKATVFTYALAFEKINTVGELLEGAEFELPFYVIRASDEETNNVYIRVKDNTEDATNKVTTKDDGIIIIKGVVEGSYNITESAAPTGYNKVDGNIVVTATKTGKETTEVKLTRIVDVDGNEVSESSETTITTEFDVNPIPISAYTVVVNRAGNLLPSTGGIGTTIFYVVGGLLAAGAGVLLITKKRMRKEQ